MLRKSPRPTNANDGVVTGCTRGAYAPQHDVRHIQRPAALGDRNFLQRDAVLLLELFSFIPILFGQCLYQSRRIKDLSGVNLTAFVFHLKMMPGLDGERPEPFGRDVRSNLGRERIGTSRIRHGPAFSTWAIKHVIIHAGRTRGCPGIHGNKQ